MNICTIFSGYIVLPAKSDSDVMFCLQSYWGFRIDTVLLAKSCFAYKVTCISDI